MRRQATQWLGSRIGIENQGAEITLANSFLPNTFERIAALIAAIGTNQFYDRVLALLVALVDYERRLVVKYSRFSAPEFLVNESMDEESTRNYLGWLYRLDPLLRLVSEGNVPTVTTFAQMRSEDHSNAFYDEIFKSGKIFDELVLFLEAPGGTYIAFCFDHDSRLATPEEIAAFRAVEPVVSEAHRLHVQNAIVGGLESIYGDRRVGVLVTDAEGHAIYRNSAWETSVPDDQCDELIQLAFSGGEREPSNWHEHVLHWEHLDLDVAQVGSSRILFLESHAPGYLKTDIETALAAFCSHYRLSHRERQIVEKTMLGYPTSLIAEKLELSAGTIKNYKQRLYLKLDITSEREIFSLFMSHLLGLI
ncbi:hypothetical protein DM872_10690 [Pseudomonas taiwanensis]|uniref:helix-turn-helix transcriptional regulator n=1 Tax=Pseudomonas taiwanensis TaxID=470150 RepID=UPI0015C06095|nr:helix-turn-helix transcriptional regulator [Pseudomonas taiwanensis]NWL77321.1 hypothetical protein [Pseudomonas taiwanensis]